MAKSTDLYLLGSGIRGPLQLTRETVQALGACRAAFVLHDDPAVHEEVARYCPIVHDVADAYKDAADRVEAYGRIAALVVEEAAGYPTVAFVAHGHPLFLVSASELILDQARDRGLVARVLPAVSSLDTILCDLAADLGYAMQIYDATHLVESKFSLDPRVPTLIFNLASFDTRAVVGGEPDPVVLAPLVAFLTAHYPVDHPCEVIYSATSVVDRPARDTVPLESLSVRFPGELWRRPTLLMWPVEREASPR
jgi:siroheme synthase